MNVYGKIDTLNQIRKTKAKIKFLKEEYRELDNDRKYARDVIEKRVIVKEMINVMWSINNLKDVLYRLKLRVF